MPANWVKRSRSRRIRGDAAVETVLAARACLRLIERAPGVVVFRRSQLVALFRG